MCTDRDTEADTDTNSEMSPVRERASTEPMCDYSITAADAEAFPDPPAHDGAPQIPVDMDLGNAMPADPPDEYLGLDLSCGMNSDSD